MTADIRFATVHLTDLRERNTLARAIGGLQDEIDAAIDLVFVFVTPPLAGSLTGLVDSLVEWFGTPNILGCTAESVIVGGVEIQWQPAVSLWAASLPGSVIDTCHLRYQQLDDDAAFVGWSDAWLGRWPANSTLFSLADPLSFPMDVFLQRINDDRPHLPVIGGMCSGGPPPAASQLILGNQAFSDGAVIVRVSGDFEIRSLVSQGCRPIGSPMVVTKAQGNEVIELGGKSALGQINDLFVQLPTREQQLVNRGLHLGRAINEYQAQFSYGDFLIRNVVGINEQAGSIVVADIVRPGQTVQFHIRDEETAHTDLKELLAGFRHSSLGVTKAGLLFSCNGRGTRLFSVPHHDASLIQEILGSIPLAGFFAAGEIGPVGGVNFLHGFTASLALFQQRL